MNDKQMKRFLKSIKEAREIHAGKREPSRITLVLIKKGLQAAKEGKVHKAKEDYSKYIKRNNK